MKDPHCSRCYRGKAIEPRHLCTHHLRLHRCLDKKKREQGLCYRCDKPAVEGLVVCETHARVRSVNTAITKHGRPPRRLTRWNPMTPDAVVRFVYLTNPYLHQGWDTTVQLFIHKHYDLWLPCMDTTWRKRSYADTPKLQALCG